MKAFKNYIWAIKNVNVCIFEKNCFYTPLAWAMRDIGIFAQNTNRERKENAIKEHAWLTKNDTNRYN